MHKNMVAAFTAGADQGLQLVRNYITLGKTMRQLHVSLFLHRYGKAGRAPPADVANFLAINVERSNESYSLKSLSAAFYGLQWSTSSPETRRLLSALADKMEQSQQVFDSQAVGNALYGLQRTTDGPEARRVLAAVTFKMKQAGQLKMNAQNISNALYGLQRIGGCVEMREFLKELAPSVKGCSDNFLTQNISNSLYGLQLCGQLDEVRPILSELAFRIVEGDRHFTSQAIAMSFNGVQRCTDSVELRAMMALLSVHLAKCKGALAGRQVVHVLNAVRGKPVCEEYNAVLLALAQQIQNGFVNFNEVVATEACQVLENEPDTAEMSHIRQVLREYRQK